MVYTTNKNGDDLGMIYYCFIHITMVVYLIKLQSQGDWDICSKSEDFWFSWMMLDSLVGILAMPTW
jgi:hypothetical protein